jgi:hypothetical protein
VISEILEKDHYKATDKLYACVEDIIQAFSDGGKTCKDCRKLVADIISDRLLAGHELETREPDVNQIAKRIKIIYA